MREVRFRERAEVDLRTTLEWFSGFGAETAARVFADIFRSIDFPDAGMQIPGTTARRIVTRRYRFKIVYEIGAGEIVVIGIYRSQNRSS